MSDRIGVILVNYNGKKYNDKCIESILRSTVKERIQVIVVDNSSTDGSMEELREYWGENPQIRIISLDKNYGFSRANNEGIKAALAQGIQTFLLLNNDTEVKSDTIEKMERDQKQTKAIVVSKIYYADKPEIIWCAGGEFSRVIKKPKQLGLNQPDSPEFQVGRYCGFANGCSLMLTKDIIDKIGFLDEKFFLYYEDTEYSLRAAEKGIPIWYCADAVVYHKVNGSTMGNEKPDSAYYITRNWLLCNYLHRKDQNCVKGWFLLFLFYFACNRAAWFFIWLVQGKPKLVFAIWRGVLDYCKGKLGKAEYYR